MNHIYRIVWSELANAWVAVAENVRTHGKRSGGAMICMAIAATPAWSLDANTLPNGGQVVAGMASIGRIGNTLNVNQASQRAAIDWQSFNVGSAATVNFQQPSASAVALNRILGNEASQIYGKLNANGQVFFSNPNGVLFARGAQVNVGGILATTLSIGNSDFMAGNYKFANPGNGAIRNEGLINAAGSAALVGNSVQNAGQIVATTATLLAGNRVAIDLTGDGLIHARIEEPSLQALIENSGSINAITAVTLTAGQARSALDRIVNNSGVVRASGLVERGGDILLEAATIESSGILDANSGAGQGGTINLKATENIALTDTSKLGADGTAGGSITAIVRDTNGELNGELIARGEISAQGASVPGSGGFVETSAATTLVADGFRVNTRGGNWLIDPADYIIAATGGNISGSTLSSNLTGGSVTILSSSGTAGGGGDINVNDSVSWSANTLTLTAARDININAVMTASSTSSLVMNPATANGSDGSVPGGTVKIGFDSDGRFRGRVDFPGRTGIGFLTINTENYHVINSLGPQGSTSQADLQGMLANVYKNYALGQNVDAIATTGWAGGGFDPVGTFGTPFSAKFDGLGHTISNLTINRPTDPRIGLFGVVGTGQTLRNVGLTSINITGEDTVGGLVGSNSGTISGSFVRGGSVTSADVGIGGLVGENQATGAISRSYSSVTVTGDGSSFGGLVGVNLGTISSSYAVGNVLSTGSIQSNFGGLTGDNRGSITNSYATGDVTGGSQSSSTGGLVGVNGTGGAITNSYATGLVSVGPASGSFGGLLGSNSGSVVGSYWNTVTSGQPSSAGGTPLTTAQMRQLASFAGWNISNVGGSTSTWRIYEGLSYPVLRDYLIPLSVTAIDASKTYDGLAYSGGNGVTYSTPPNITYLLGAVNYSGTSQGAINAGSYTITPGGLYSNQNGYDVRYVNGTLTVDPAVIILDITGTLAGTVSKVYDGTPMATLAPGNYLLTGWASGEGADVRVTKTAGIYESSNAGSGLLVTANLSGSDYLATTTNLANYNLPTTITGRIGTISQRPLSLTFEPISKTYDGNTSAVMPAPTVANVLANDAASLTLTGGAGHFDTRHVGTNKNVTYTGMSLGGSAAGNYVLGGATFTGKGTINQLASVEWVGGPSGDWMTPTNWAGGALPDNNNVATAIFPYSVSVISGGPFDLGDTRITANGGNFQLETFGGLTTGSGAIQVPAGQMTLITHSPMVVGTGGLQAGTGITLQSLTPDPNSTITLNGPLTSTRGSVAVSAYGNIFQNASITAPSVSMISSQGNIIVASHAVTTAGSIYYAAPMGFIDASPSNFSGSFPFFQANSLPASLQALMAAPAALQQAASAINQLQEEEQSESETSLQSRLLPQVLAESDENPERGGPAGREGAASEQEIFRLLIANSLIERPLEEVILLPLNPSRGLVCR